MKKYDEFELDLKNEKEHQTQPTQLFSSSEICIETAMTIVHYSKEHHCSRGCKPNRYTVNTCKTA